MEAAVEVGTSASSIVEDGLPSGQARALPAHQYSPCTEARRVKLESVTQWLVAARETLHSALQVNGDADASSLGFDTAKGLQVPPDMVAMSRGIGLEGDPEFAAFNDTCPLAASAEARGDLGVLHAAPSSAEIAESSSARLVALPPQVCDEAQRLRGPDDVAGEDTPVLRTSTSTSSAVRFAGVCGQRDDGDAGDGAPSPRDEHPGIEEQQEEFDPSRSSGPQLKFAWHALAQIRAGLGASQAQAEVCFANSLPLAPLPAGDQAGAARPVSSGRSSTVGAHFADGAADGGAPAGARNTSLHAWMRRCADAKIALPSCVEERALRPDTTAETGATPDGDAAGEHAAERGGGARRGLLVVGGATLSDSGRRRCQADLPPTGRRQQQASLVARSSELVAVAARGVSIGDSPSQDDHGDTGGSRPCVGAATSDRGAAPRPGGKREAGETPSAPSAARSPSAERDSAASPPVGRGAPPGRGAAVLGVDGGRRRTPSLRAQGPAAAAGAVETRSPRRGGSPLAKAGGCAARDRSSGKVAAKPKAHASWDQPRKSVRARLSEATAETPDGQGACPVELPQDEADRDTTPLPSLTCCASSPELTFQNSAAVPMEGCATNASVDATPSQPADQRFVVFRHVPAKEAATGVPPRGPVRRSGLQLRRSPSGSISTGAASPTASSKLRMSVRKADTANSVGSGDQPKQQRRPSCRDAQKVAASDSCSSPRRQQQSAERQANCPSRAGQLGVAAVTSPGRVAPPAPEGLSTGHSYSQRIEGLASMSGMAPTAAAAMSAAPPAAHVAAATPGLPCGARTVPVVFGAPTSFAAHPPQMLPMGLASLPTAPAAAMAMCASASFQAAAPYSGGCAACAAMPLRPQLCAAPALARGGSMPAFVPHRLPSPGRSHSLVQL